MLWALARGIFISVLSEIDTNADWHDFERRERDLFSQVPGGEQLTMKVESCLNYFWNNMDILNMELTVYQVFSEA